MGELGCGLRAAADDTVMMQPVLRSFMPGRKLLMVKNVAPRLPSTDARHPSSLISSKGAGLVMPPALATRMSTQPSWFSMSWRIASTSENFVTSPVRLMACPPACSISPRTAVSADGSRPCMTTLAPWSANKRAMPAPIPRELPVISATLFFKCCMVHPFGSGIASRRHADYGDGQKNGGDTLRCDASTPKALDAGRNERCNCPDQKDVLSPSRRPGMDEVPEQPTCHDDYERRPYLR